MHSSDNLTNLFTKSLSISTFKRLIHKIRMHQPKDIETRESMFIKGCQCTVLFFPFSKFYHIGFY